MIGVVLWYDNLQNKAVIWCEDHAELGFFNSQAVPCEEEMQLAVGDIIEFDVKIIDGHRHVCSPKLISDSSYDALLNTLMQITPTASPPKGKVIPFAKIGKTFEKDAKKNLAS